MEKGKYIFMPQKYNICHLHHIHTYAYTFDEKFKFKPELWLPPISHDSKFPPLALGETISTLGVHYTTIQVRHATLLEEALQNIKCYRQNTYNLLCILDICVWNCHLKFSRQKALLKVPSFFRPKFRDSNACSSFWFCTPFNDIFFFYICHSSRANQD